MTEDETREKLAKSLLASFPEPSGQAKAVAHSASLAILLRDQRIKELERRLAPSTFTLATATHIGSRATNQDRALAVRSRSGSAWVAVVDGMGGHPNGDGAAEVAMGAIQKEIATLRSQPQQAIRVAHDAVTKLAEPRHGRRTPGAAAAIVAIRPLEDGRALYQCANVGDVRAYKLHEQGWTLLSVDQNVNGALYQAGRTSLSDLTEDPCESGLLTYLGDPVHGGAQPIVSTGFLSPGEGILVVSDGVWDPIHRSKQPAPRPPDGWIKLASPAALEELCLQTVQLSTRPDNATAAIAIFGGEP